MTWNWEQSDWPEFIYDPVALAPLEKQFLLQAGQFIGACKHMGANDRETLRIELISDEAVKTSQIEGEISIATASNPHYATNLGLGSSDPASSRPSAALRG